MSLSWPGVAGTAINLSVGTLGAVGAGPYTVVVLANPSSTSADGLLQMNAAGGGVAIYILSGNFYGNSTFSGDSFGTAVAGDWQIIGQSKASGFNVYRWHYWDMTTGGAKSHANSVGASGNPGTITTVQIGNSTNAGNGLIAVVGVWKRVLSDAEFNSLCTSNLSDWAALAPDALLPLNVAAASVVDVTGNGANATSVTGTISAGADPPGFNYTLAAATATPQPIVAPSPAVIRASTW